MNDKAHTHKKPVPEPTPQELRRRNVVRYGTTMTPLNVPVNPDELAAGLAACASAGLPEPIVTAEDVTPPEGLPYVIDVYTFVHFRYPQVQLRVTVTEVAIFHTRVIQLAKNAGIRADSLAITDDPPIALSAPPPPVV